MQVYQSLTAFVPCTPIPMISHLLSFRTEVADMK